MRKYTDTAIRSRDFDLVMAVAERQGGAASSRPPTAGGGVNRTHKEADLQSKKLSS